MTDPARRPTPIRLGLAVTPAVAAVFEAALAVPIRQRPVDAGALWAALTAAAKSPESNAGEA